MADHGHGGGGHGGGHGSSGGILSGDAAKMIGIVVLIIVVIWMVKSPGGGSTGGYTQSHFKPISTHQGAKYTGKSCRRADGSTGREGYGPQGQLGCWRF